MKRPMSASATLAFCAAAGLTLTGCTQYGPPGDRGGRVDPGNTVAYEYRDPAAPTADLRQFAGEAVEQIALQIADTPEITSSPTKVVIALGAITNRTNTPTNDFIAVRRRVFTGLVNSVARQHADIIEQPEIMQGQLDRYAPRNTDPVDENLGQTGEIGRYDPNLIYVLQGEFGELQRLRGQVSDYYFDFTLTNLKSGKIVMAVENRDGLKIDRRR